MEDNIDEDPIFSNWRKMYDLHPNGELLKNHVERATQDIFFISLKEQSPSIFHLFRTKEQIDKFLSKILEYWEKQENFEKCKEIVILSEKLLALWKNREKDKNKESKSHIDDWLNSSSD